MPTALNTMFSKKALLGDRNVCFYESLEQKQSVLFSNLKTGLYQDCAALYVANEENIEQLKGQMRKFGLKSDATKKLRIITSHQFYTPDGEFHVKRVTRQVRSNLDEILDSGFKGLYLSVDVSKVFDYFTKKGITEKWLEYEGAVGRTVPFPVEIMCTYNVNQVKPSDQVFLKLIQSYKNTVNAKNLDFVDNKKICIQAVTEELDRILGDKSTELVFRFLEKQFKVPRNQIIPQIVEFNKCLELLLGDGAETIEKHILKKLHKKTGILNMCAQSG